MARLTKVELTCDRCGQFASLERNQSEFSAWSSLGHTLNAPDGAPPQPVRSHDLCPVCTLDFETFMLPDDPAAPVPEWEPETEGE